MWTCAGCREGHDDDADVCWNCGTDRAGRPDPGFRRADEPDPPPARPVGVAAVCPGCGAAGYESVRPAEWVAFRSDRRCTGCGTLYTPPTPRWAGVLLLVVGIVFAPVGGPGLVATAVVVALGGPPLLLLLCPLQTAAAVVGAAAFSQGLRAIRHPGRA